MRLNNHVLFLPSLLAITGVVAQQSASPTSGTPDVTYPTDDAFVFCSAQDCTGTCEVADTAGLDAKAGHVAPNDMGFLSMYWYDPGSYAWDVFTCVNYSTCGTAVGIGPNTCYNLYDNGTPTDFYEYYFLV
ncbi:hypothetical protein J3R83DRAFT_1370, partial [Lanmaoa asiatica]